MSSTIVYVLTVLLVLSHVTRGARILGICPSSAPSHSRTLEALLNELAQRGHHVTFASAVPAQLDPPSNSSGGSFSSVFLDGGGVLEGNMEDIVGPNRDPLRESLALWRAAPLVCKNELQSPQLQPLIRDKTIKFDLVIAEVFFFDCMLPFSRHFSAPLIGFTSHWPPPWTHGMVGNPLNPSVTPNFFLPYGDDMGFLERMHNSVFTLGLLIARQWLYLPRQDAVVREVFGPDTPPISELETHTALVLSNTNPVLNFAHANVPAIIEVGGMHIKTKKPLPKDLQDYFDRSRDGLVVFSLGTMINSGNLSPEGLGLLTSAMAAVPCAVLWRWDSEDVPGLPGNVRIIKWMPQRDVLAHPNVRLLVTHGGLLSAQEAMIEGVPRLIIPFFGDQRMNAWRAVETGVALKLDFYKTSPQQMIEAITILITDQSYALRAKKLSRAYTDQPESPLDRAIFWTEYVIRHEGAPHLTSAASHLSWYQLYLIDVAAVIIAIVIVLLFLVTKLVRVCTDCSQKRSNLDSKKTK